MIYRSRTRAPRTDLRLSADQNLFFICREKKDPHIRIPAGFPGPGWAELCGEKSLDLRAFGSHQERCFPVVFWHLAPHLGVFSTGTEKKDISGFSGIDRITNEGKGARIGLICPQDTDPHIPGIFDRGRTEGRDLISRSPPKISFYLLNFKK